jgi:hypothetical protein
LQNPLARTRIIARIIKKQPHATTSVPSNMASPSQRATQDYDQDMADSSSPQSNKCGQLSNQLINQQKKIRSDLQSEHAQYTSQDIWLSFQAMELITKDSEALLQETHMSIREMIRKGYRENEAAEAHIAKVSFPRIPQQKWPSSRTNRRSSHHYHLTQVPSEIEVNT